MALSLWGCVVWAIVETSVKADAWPTRLNVAMGAIGLDALCFIWLIVLRAFSLCASLYTVPDRRFAYNGRL
jgi:hypothetical protein